MIHKAKKSLGQNFLKSEEALRTMCIAGELTAKDIVLEIGPGKGALTEKLLDKCKKVIAVEKDRDLVKFLEEKFEDKIKIKKLEIIQDDILEFNPVDYGLKESEYKIIANIPYNITGSIIRKFLSGVIQPCTMVLLVQKEVATRIVARDNKESILSLSVKAYGDPKYIMKVGKRFFSPSPKVDSAIVAITNISKSTFKKDTNLENKFFEVVKAGFAHKRKLLKKNLEVVTSSNTIRDMFEDLEINDNARAEDVPFHLWTQMANYLNK